MKLDDLAHRCCLKKTTALVGAGGKTTLMLWLAQRCADWGKKVLVTTTTHIFCPDEGYESTAEGVRQRWTQGEYAVIGTPGANGKLTAAPTVLEALKNEAEVILVEADGSKRLPCKIPADHEPVIPEDCGLVVAVMGMSALGKPLKDCCFRFAQAGQWLHVAEHAALDEKTAFAILSHHRGSRKNVKSKEYIAVLNQCDNEILTHRAEEIQKRLKADGITAICTCLKAQEKSENDHAAALSYHPSHQR